MNRIVLLTTALTTAVGLAAPAASLQAQDASRPGVTVAPFVNAGRPPAAREYDGLGKAIADFLTTSLSANEKLRVVPREQAQRALDAQHPAAAADRAAAVRAARAQNARYVVVGAYDVDARGFMRIDGRGVDAGSGEVLFTDRVQGRADDLVSLTEQLGARIAAGLQWPPGQTGPAGTKLTVRQAALYGRALDFADRGDRPHAVETLEALLKDAPGYGPARGALGRLGAAP
jgi:TolB-like protein